ncbi:hypothetical protein BDW75DRAFT_233730 [Aspergillus navahoensis]
MDQPKDPVQEFFYLISVSFLAIAAYNTLELLCWIFDFFKRWQGLYFWSILTATVTVGAFMVIATLATFEKSSPLALGISIAFVYPCILVSQALVLYSRLYLITKGRIVTFVLWLIIISSVGLYIPSITVLVGASAGNRRFFGTQIEHLNERYATVGSIAREFLICGIYIYEAIRHLKPIMHIKGRAGLKVLIHLIAVNVAVVLLDLLIVMSLCTTKYHIRGWYRGAGIPYGVFAQSVKLKIEFSVLNKLVGLLDAPVVNGELPWSTRYSSHVEMLPEASRCLTREGLTLLASPLVTGT